MQSYTIHNTIPAANPKHIKEKKELIDKILNAIQQENNLPIIGPMIFTTGPRKTELLQRFIRNIDTSFKTNINKVVLGDMLTTARRELGIIEARAPEHTERVQRTLNIIYRNGIIKPNKFPVSTAGYHWELQTKWQQWDQIGAPGQLIIRPGQTNGKVRLHFNNNVVHLISNSIDIQTVIKRQSSAAKRLPYTFGRTDVEFITRCKGVAGRILRLTEPRNAKQPTLIANRFSMRVFQDRVSRLPSYLNMSVLNIITLCGYELSPRRQRQRDDNYIRMIEFCEPTVHLNPDALRRTLKRIASGENVTLQLGDVVQVVDSGSDDDTDTDGSRQFNSDFDNTSSSNDESDFNNSEEETEELSRAELVQLAKGGKLSEYGGTGKSSSADIRAALAALSG